MTVVRGTSASVTYGARTASVNQEDFPSSARLVDNQTSPIKDLYNVFPLIEIYHPLNIRACHSCFSSITRF